VGVQSLNDDRLRFLGRLHDAAGGLKAVRAALESGIPRVSADLIFGLPGQSPKEACEEATALLELGVEHLSLYQLTIEPGTRFGELAKRGRLPLADDGLVAESFLALDDVLTSLPWGFVHYEISNYARAGCEARHNVGYWRGEEYLGLGCAAYGFQRTFNGDTHGSPAPLASGIRYRNEVLPERYLRGGPSSDESLDAQTLMRERIMLGLRMADGFDLEEAARALGIAGWTPERERAASKLERRGRIVREGTRVRIPRAAWLWADDSASSLF
jgi:oxygen-independent coproporphyrinogen-3 oxidase